MKTIVTLFLVAFMALFIGCGGGGGSTSTDTQSSSSTPNNTASTYDYNSDKSAVRKLANSYVNTYEDVQSQLNAHKNDKSAFNLLVDRFVIEIMDDIETTDTIPSTAPRGENSSYLATVSNNSIDYSSYTLKGDVNNDNKVDFDDIDLFKSALFSSDDSEMYDVNGDNDVDIKDLIDIAARINTQIAYFDFYTPQGTKLNIPTRTVNEAKITSYDGNLTQVMVVAKDENMASSFLDTLSDINDVWYKKSGWVFEETIVTNESSIARSAKRTNKNELIQNAISEVTTITPSPYLVGWHFSATYVETGSFAELDEYGLEGSEFFLNKTTDKIDSYFRKSNMNNPAKRVLNKKEFHYHIGSINAKKNEVKAKRIGLKQAFSLDGEKIFINQYATAASVLYESIADKTLNASIGKDPAMSGKITLHRVGPDKEGDFEGSIDKNKVVVKNLPYGEFTPSVEDACSCSVDADAIVFDKGVDNITLSLPSDISKANVVLTVLDSNDNPQKNKSVEIRAKACLDQGSGSNSVLLDQEGVSDSSGKVRFDNVLIGDYEVYIDGKKIKDIHFCETSEYDIIINPLWRFHVQYNHPEWGSGTFSAEDIEIDFDASSGLGGTKMFTIHDDSTCGGDLSSCGSLLIYSGITTPMVVQFEAQIYTIPELGFEDVTSYEIVLGNNGFVCDGSIPTGFNAGSESTQWSWSAGYQSCSYTLEPMQ